MASKKDTKGTEWRICGSAPVAEAGEPFHPFLEGESRWRAVRDLAARADQVPSYPPLTMIAESPWLRAVAFSHHPRAALQFASSLDPQGALATQHRCEPGDRRHEAPRSLTS
jgi:hypothetical protein